MYSPAVHMETQNQGRVRIQEMVEIPQVNSQVLWDRLRGSRIHAILQDPWFLDPPTVWFLGTVIVTRKHRTCPEGSKMFKVLDLPTVGGSCGAWFMISWLGLVDSSAPL